MPSPVSQILPSIPWTSDRSQPGRSEGLHGKSAHRRGLVRVYGWTGVVMFVAFVLSGVWTLALAIVQVLPSDVANFLMGTGKLDSGDFWTLPHIDGGIALPAVALLVAVAVGYFALAALMIQMSLAVPTSPASQSHQPRAVHPSDDRSNESELNHRKNHTPGNRSSRQSIVARLRNPSVRMIAMANPHQRARIWRVVTAVGAKVLNTHGDPALALPKLMLQTSILLKYLREGFPRVTISIYAVLLLLNWMISAYCVMVQLVDPRAKLVRIFYSFDLFFAVFAPLQMIVYAYHNFVFDRVDFDTRLEVFNPGNFDVIARLFADPTEVSIFRAAFRSLQLSSVWSLAVKIVLNAVAIRRWWRGIQVVDPSVPIPQPIGGSRVRYSKRSARLLALLFVGLGGSVFVYTLVAVVSSTSICTRFVHCKVPSYRWNVGVQQCSCSVFVDRETRVKTFDEWENPIDTTANLAALAASGDLRVVQIINRQLPTLPVEMRGCRGLEQLILIYTKITTLPDWTQELEHLEYLHIEGDMTAKQLQALPTDLFLSMSKLSFLHLGCLPQVPSVPDLCGVPKLKYLTLAMLYSVISFPSFDKLVNLEQLNIIDAAHVEVLPPIAQLGALNSLVIAGRNAMCCNGYLGDGCDLTDFSCRDRTDRGEQGIKCTKEHSSPTDRLVIARVGRAVCVKGDEFDLSEAYVTREASDDACGGVLYKRCVWKGQPGICFPTRIMAVMCETFAPYEAMRRLQIERGVGDPCDPIVEEWLGCRKHRGVAS